MKTPNFDLRRKVYEALGWVDIRFVQGCSKRESRLIGLPPNYRDEADLPPIELSNGLALDALVEFCGHMLGWRISSAKSTLPTVRRGAEEIDIVRCTIFRHGQLADRTVGSGEDETPAFAICRAIAGAKK